MEKYMNDKCPVCERQFEHGDDIVVCPECGTPHHRECYSQLHRCANAAKHKSGFVFESVEVEEEKKEYSSPQEEYEDMLRRQQKAAEQDGGEESKCHICGNPVEKGATMCIHCGAVLGSSPLSENYSQFSGEAARDDEIDGQSVADIADAVGTNATRFIMKFRKNRKVSWNWCAFLFGPYYLLYRKMYRAGAITLIVSVSLNLICQGFFAEKLTRYVKLINSSMYSDLFKGNPFENTGLLTQLAGDPTYKAVVPYFFIVFAIAIAVRLFCALFADVLYRQYILRTVKEVNDRLGRGDVFAPAPMFASPDNLTQKQMKSLFLNRKGGVSIFAPVAAYFAYSLLMQLISSII